MNFNSKFGKNFLKFGNFLAMIVSVNLIWIIISLPSIAMLLIMIDSRTLKSFLTGLVLLTIMNSVFLLPATTDVYLTILKLESKKMRGSFFKKTFINYLNLRAKYFFFLLFSLLASGWLFLFMNFKDQVFKSAFLLGVGLILMAVFLAWSLSLSPLVEESWYELIFSAPLKLLGASLILLALIMVNVFLRLSFLLILCSISLAAYLAIKLLWKEDESVY